MKLLPLAATSTQSASFPAQIEPTPIIVSLPSPPEALPPPPKVQAPPPPFIPPPEINIAPPPTPAPTISAVTRDAPPAPQAPMIQKVPESAPPAPAQPAIRSAQVACANYREVMSSIVYPRDALQGGIEGEVVIEFTGGANGEIKDTVIKSSSNRIFNRASMAVVSNLKCQSGGQDIRVQAPISFKIR